MGNLCFTGLLFALRRKSWFILPTLFVAMYTTIAVACSQATRIYVHPNGDDANDGMSWSNAKRTIQAAVDAVASGGEVWVAQGTFDPLPNREGSRVVRITKPIKLYGDFRGLVESWSDRDHQRRNGADSIVNVNCLCEESCVGIKIDGDFSGEVVIDGFLVRSSGCPGDIPGHQAIDANLIGDTVLTIQGNVITRSADWGGFEHGINITGSCNANIHSNSIENCSYAIRVVQSGGSIQVNISQNTITTNGIGIHVAKNGANTSGIGTVRISNSVLSNNFIGAQIVGRYLSERQSDGFIVDIKESLFYFNGSEALRIEYPKEPSQIIGCQFVGNGTAQHFSGVGIRVIGDAGAFHGGRLTPRVIRVSRCLVERNTSSGIIFDRISGVIDNCTISENGLMQQAGFSGVGIELLYSASLVTMNSVCKNGGGGIKIQTLDSVIPQGLDITVTRNKIQSNKSTAIIIDTKAGMQCLLIRLINNLISHNTSTCNTPPAIRAFGFGGNLLALLVANNTIVENSVISDSSTGCLCASGNLGAIDLDFTGSTTVFLVNNILSYNRYPGSDVITYNPQRITLSSRERNFIKCNLGSLAAPESVGLPRFYHRVPLQLVYDSNMQLCKNVNLICSASYRLRPDSSCIDTGVKVFGRLPCGFASCINSNETFEWSHEPRETFWIWRDLYGENRPDCHEPEQLDTGCDEFYSHSWFTGGLPDSNHIKDGIVDDSDLLSVILSFGQTYSGCEYHQADVNGDYYVDDVDLLLVLLRFGQRCSDCPNL